MLVVVIHFSVHFLELMMVVVIHFSVHFNDGGSGDTL
jgi:hypothetical protein